MQSKEIHIAVDVMGGDKAPDVVVQGIQDVLQLREAEHIHIHAVGPQGIVEPLAALSDRCYAHVATEVIDMAEHPAQAVRSKKDSSLVVGAQLVKDGIADGFFSAGSTGACLAAGILVMGRIKGVKRPALCTIIPSPIKPVVMADVGANADCKPEYLLQFGQMAVMYARDIIGIENPRAALLNIGEEETKGSEFAQAAYALLKQHLPEFAGNGEGTDIIPANYDVFITDGFTGNVAIKTIEGTSKALFKSIKDIFKTNMVTKLSALGIKTPLVNLAQSISPDTYGGAPLLGVRGALLVGHGSSSSKAIKNGILTCAKMVESNLVSRIEAQIHDV
ncbi:MAG: phosphate acyltransferase PlsX [Eggerthellaceae bacterium]|nr:phosphate acyltransferase PlsX [Eggerthellaceae bacterium]